MLARQVGTLVKCVKNAVTLIQLSPAENVGNTIGATQRIITGAAVVMQRMSGIVHGMVFAPFAEKRHQRSGGTAQVHEFPACGAAFFRAAGAGELIFDAAVAVVLAVPVAREVEHRHIVPNLQTAAHIRGDRQRNLNFAGKGAHRILEIGVRAGELAAAGVAGLDRDAVDGFIRDIVGRFQLNLVFDFTGGLDVAFSLPADGTRIGDFDQLSHADDVDVEGIRRFQSTFRSLPVGSIFSGNRPEVKAVLALVLAVGHRNDAVLDVPIILGMPVGKIAVVGFAGKFAALEVDIYFHFVAVHRNMNGIIISPGRQRFEYRFQIGEVFPEYRQRAGGAPFFAVNAFTGFCVVARHQQKASAAINLRFGLFVAEWIRQRHVQLTVLEKLVLAVFDDIAEFLHVVGGVFIFIAVGTVEAADFFLFEVKAEAAFPAPFHDCVVGFGELGVDRWFYCQKCHGASSFSIEFREMNQLAPEASSQAFSQVAISYQCHLPS